MTHAEAVEQQMVERYFLGELREDEANAFEQHYFECVACAEDVRLTADFQEAAKEALAMRPDPQRAPARTEERSNWLSWLVFRPSWALAAVFMCIAGWQTLFRIPRLEHLAQVAQSPQEVAAAVLRSETRGDAPTITIPRSQRSLLLIFDVNTEAVEGSYEAELKREGGAVIFSKTINAPPPGTSVNLLVPASGLAPGSYTLTVHGRRETQSGEGIGVYRFVLQIS